jgi:hypothetical protein
VHQSQKPAQRYQDDVLEVLEECLELSAEGTNTPSELVVIIVRAGTRALRLRSQSIGSQLAVDDLRLLRVRKVRAC